MNYEMYSSIIICNVTIAQDLLHHFDRLLFDYVKNQYHIVVTLPCSRLSLSFNLYIFTAFKK